MKLESVVMTFESTHQAIAFEAAAQALRLPGRLIPLPQAISAGCGLAWLFEEDIGQLRTLRHDRMNAVIAQSEASGKLYRLVASRPDRFERIDWSPYESGIE